MEQFFNDLGSVVSNVVSSLLFLILALILATVAKRFVIKGLHQIDFDLKTMEWGIAKNEEEGNSYIDTIGSVLYFIVIFFFLPGILNGLNIGGVMDPIVNMFNKFFSYIPNIILAVLIVVVGTYFCRFVKQLVKNLLTGLNVDRWYRKLTQTDEGLEVTDDQLAEVLANIVYVLIFIPILTVALEILGIQSISEPIVNVLNQMLSAIPNILTAVVLFIIGGFIAKLAGDLIEKLVATTGVDQYSRYLNFKADSNSFQISEIIAWLLKGVMVLFFTVEALSVLQLDVLNTIGAAIIAYLPSVLSALLILGLAIATSNLSSSLVRQSTESVFLAELVRYGIIAIASFMILEQLNIAQTIVNAGFIIVLGSVGLAFGLAFGLGGRDYARQKLNQADQAMSEEIESSQETEAKDLT